MVASITSISSLAGATDALYGGPLDGFVSTRDALAKQIRAGGDRAMADEIKAMRKPTVAADALNRAIRDDPEALERLLTAVDALRRTQEAMLAGEEADFATDQAAYRAAVDAVAAKAPSHQVEVRAALEAAAVGGREAELRAAGFAALPEPEGGFGPFAAGAGTVATSRGPKAVPGRTSAIDRDVDTNADTSADTDAGGEPAKRGPSAAERRMAERARLAAERAVADAEAERRAAEEVAAVAADQVAAIDEELAELGERLETARRQRDDAVEARAKAEAGLAAATAQLDEARGALDQL